MRFSKKAIRRSSRWARRSRSRITRSGTAAAIRKGIKGKDIPLTGRICAMTDVFDALVSTRPYKKAWPLNEVLETLKKGKAQHFDPALVDEFLQIIPDVQKVRKALPDSEAA